VEDLQQILTGKVKINAEFLSSSELFARASQRNFTALIAPLRYTRVDPYPFFHNSFSGSNNGFNYSGIADKDVDIAVEDYRMGEAERSEVIDIVKNYYSFFEINNTSLNYHTDMAVPNRIYSPEYRFLFYWRYN
jgi:hypothetical protein